MATIVSPLHQGQGETRQLQLHHSMSLNPAHCKINHTRLTLLIGGVNCQTDLHLSKLPKTNDKQ